MSYSYDCSDTDFKVKAGGTAGVTITCGGIIAEDDSYGGFNVTFSISTANAGLYHVHFNGNGKGKRAELPGKVNVVRYKSSSSDAGGNNIIKFFQDNSDNTRKTLSQLAHDCGTKYPNHQRLLSALAAAWTTWKAG